MHQNAAQFRLQKDKLRKYEESAASRQERNLQLDTGNVVTKISNWVNHRRVGSGAPRA